MIAVQSVCACLTARLFVQSAACVATVRAGTRLVERNAAGPV